jgi:hypothetical protein
MGVRSATHRAAPRHSRHRPSMPGTADVSRYKPYSTRTRRSRHQTPQAILGTAGVKRRGPHSAQPAQPVFSRSASRVRHSVRTSRRGSPGPPSGDGSGHSSGAAPSHGRRGRRRGRPHRPDGHSDHSKRSRSDPTPTRATLTSDLPCRHARRLLPLFRPGRMTLTSALPPRHARLLPASRPHTYDTHSWSPAPAHMTFTSGLLCWRA